MAFSQPRLDFFGRLLTQAISGEFRYDHNGTFTLTPATGASATLTFNGTAIWIFGAKSDNHGPYIITLDGEISTGDGFHDGPVFYQVLFSAVGLDATTPHTVSIANAPTNTSRPWLDIDSVSTLINSFTSFFWELNGRG